MFNYRFIEEGEPRRRLITHRCVSPPTVDENISNVFDKKRKNRPRTISRKNIYTTQHIQRNKSKKFELRG